MKAVIINSSPRKDFNTAQLLRESMRALKEEGVSCEWVDLYDYEFTGCKSCFACKVKGSRTNGVCAIKDAIRPVIEKCQEADILIFGSPVYFGYPTGQLRSLVERLLFPLDTYRMDENKKRLKVDHKFVATGLIYAMNCPIEWLEKVHYDVLLGFTGKELSRLYGYNEVLYSGDTYQFADYSKYDVNMFDEQKKREHRDKQFPIDLKNAYELGKKLFETVKEKESA